jgi:secondary thiamine-phosphate synthase enzyme
VGASNLATLHQTPRLVSSEEQIRTFMGELHYSTSGAGDFIDITDQVAEVVRRSGIRNGMVHICSLHTTAAIRINENEPLLLADFRQLLERLVPRGNYEHDDLTRRQGVPPSEPLNGHSHCQHLLLAASESVPLVDGRIHLGPWQRVFLIELDSPRPRRVTVQVMGC